MIEGASSLRLLEPRSLAGAERLAARAAAPPLVRSVAQGASGFADRFFHSWLGVERPMSTVPDRGPRSLEFPAPWYELPADRRLAVVPRTRAQIERTPVAVAPEGAVAREPARELRAIDLVMLNAPPLDRVGFGGPLESSPTASPALLPASSAASSPAPSPVALAAPSPAPPVMSIGQRVIDQLSRVDRLLGSIIHTSVSPVELAALAAPRTLGTIGAPILGSSMFPSAASAPVSHEVAPSLAATMRAPREQTFVTASTPSIIARTAETFLERSSAPTSYASRPRADVQSAPRAPQIGAGIERTLLSPMLTPILVPALSASPVVVAAARAAAARGFVAPNVEAPMIAQATASPSAAAVERTFASAAEPGPSRGAAAPLRAAEATPSFSTPASSFTPINAAATYAVAPTVGLAPGLAMGPPVIWPRLQSFIERIAGPAMLGDAGFVMPAAAQPFLAEPVPMGRGAEAPVGLPFVEMARPTERAPRGGEDDIVVPRRAARAELRSPPTVAPFDAPPSSRTTPVPAHSEPSPVSVAVASPVLGAVASPPAAGPSWLTGTRAPWDDGPAAEPAQYAPAATLAGELARQVAPASYRPGQFAQRAELLGTIAAQRADRQLGTTTVVQQRSVQWSSDAFTVIALVPAIASNRGPAQPAAAAAAPSRSPSFVAQTAFAPATRITPSFAAPSFAAALVAPAFAAPSSAAPSSAASSPAAPSFAVPSSAAASFAVPASFVAPSFAPPTFAAHLGAVPLANLTSTQLASVMPDAAMRTYASLIERQVTPFDRAFIAAERSNDSRPPRRSEMRPSMPADTRPLTATELAFVAQGGTLAPARASSAPRDDARASFIPSGTTHRGPVATAASSEWDVVAVGPDWARAQQDGPVAPPSAFNVSRFGFSARPFVNVMPLSIASLVAFADAQLGPRLLEGTRPLPVDVPSAVYAQPDDAPVARGTSRSAPARTYVAPAAEHGGFQRGQHTRTLDFGADFSLAAVGTFGPAAMQPQKDMPPQSPPIGQLGRRSEQLAGELGVRVGSLASEFLIDVHTNFDADTPASTLHAATAGRAWLSTSDWILLSLFPSMTTASQLATPPAFSAAGAAQSTGVHAAAAREGRFPLAANVAAPALGVRASLTMPNYALQAPTGSGVQGAPGAADEPASASHPSMLAPALSSLVAPMASAGESPTPSTAYLPDGRLPRGNRMLARTAMLPVVAGPPSASIASTVEATDRRAAAPNGGPLWGHMRPLVEPSTTSPASPPPSSARGAGKTAMELVQPYIEAARAESTGGATGFVRQATPVVVPSSAAPDSPTRSLVRAMSAASAAPVNDRLTMADLTLISVVSATQQVAASTANTPSSGGVAGTQDPGGHPLGFLSQFGHFDLDAEIHRVARHAVDEMRQIEEQKHEDHARTEGT